jgi:hypothetical protein
MEQSREYLEKQSAWESKLNELKEVTDALGEPIDAEILETVAALNLLGYKTYQSCAGHLDPERVVAPYVSFSPGDAPKLKFKGEAELRKKVAEKYNIDVEEIKEDINEQANDEFWDTINEERYEPTNEYNEHKAEVKLQREEVAKLLTEFLETRVSQNPQLFISSTGNSTRIDSVQLQPAQWRQLSVEEKQELVRRAQEEMQAFEQFAKQKYFGM